MKQKICNPLSWSATVLLAVALLTGCRALGSQSASVDRSEPLVTALQRGTDWETALPRLRRMGCNHVWLGWAAAKELVPKVKEAGLEPVLLVHPSMQTPPTRDPSQWVHCYLNSFWKEKEAGTLVLDLDEIYDPGVFYLDPRTDPARLRVVERGTGRVLPQSQWRADLRNGRVDLHGGIPGKQYRVTFPVIMLRTAHAHGHKSDLPRYTDGVSHPARRKIHYEQIRTLLSKYPSASVFRPTSLQYFFMSVRQAPDPGQKRGDYVAYSWYNYWAGMNPARFKLYEEKWGEAFDPLWIMARGYGEEGYLPHPAYRRWIDLVREEVGEYARGMNDMMHAAGRRSRWFWGDDWKGIEPWLGDVDSAGFDEVVCSLNSGPTTVRRLTGFPSEARRIIRLPWINLDRDRPDVFHERWAENWRWIKREVLFRCPDGITVGGNVRGAFDAGLAAPVVDTMRDFREVHGRIFGKRLFDNEGLKFYVADAWGAMRAWPARPVQYLSRRETLQAMVDWPVDIEFISFEKIADGGVPPDAALLLISGEPETAWAGGALWKDRDLVQAVRAYVEAGGGLLAIGGASLTDGRFALDDLLDVRFEKAATERAAQRLWNVTRWSEAGNNPSEFGSLGEAYLGLDTTWVQDHLPEPLRGAFRLAAPPRLQCDTFVNAGNPDSVIARDEEGRPAVVLSSPGKGRACYIAGYGNNQRFLKVLCFYLAGASEALDRLDSDHPTVATYAYPEERLLIVFNHGSKAAEARVRIDPSVLGVATQSQELVLSDLDTGENRRLRAEELRDGIPLSLEPGQTLYWQAGAR